MTERQINRWATIPSKDTPFHIAQIRIFDDEEKARDHAKMTNAIVKPCLDADALIEHREATKGE